MVILLRGIKQLGVCVPPWRRGLVAGEVLTVPKATNAKIRMHVVDEAGDPVDIAGATVTLSVRDDGGGCGCATTPIQVNAITLPLCGKGWCEFALTPAMTRLLDAKRYHYAIKLTAQDNSVDQIVPPSTFVLTEAP